MQLEVADYYGYTAAPAAGGLGPRAFAGRPGPVPAPTAGLRLQLASCMSVSAGLVHDCCCLWCRRGWSGGASLALRSKASQLILVKFFACYFELLPLLPLARILLEDSIRVALFSNLVALCDDSDPDIRLAICFSLELP